MKNELNFKDWYLLKNGVIYFRSDMVEANENLFQPIKYEELVIKLKNLGYNVKNENNMYYRVLNNELSSVEFDKEEHAYLDCLEHAYNNEKI